MSLEAFGRVVAALNKGLLLSEAEFPRALKRLTRLELLALYDLITEGEVGTPRERLRAKAAREQKARFMARFSRLSVQEQGAAWLRIAGGDDLDVIMNELPQSPVSTDTGHPKEGNDARTHDRPG